VSGHNVSGIVDAYAIAAEALGLLIAAGAVAEDRSDEVIRFQRD
jgi:hypothetical protein